MIRYVISSEDGRGNTDLSTADCLEEALGRFSWPRFDDPDAETLLQIEDAESMLGSAMSGRCVTFWDSDGNETRIVAEDGPESGANPALRPLVEQFATCFAALLNCRQSGNQEWGEIWGDRLEALAREHLPSGSGFDSGSSFNLEESRPDRLIFGTSFHHMDDSGMYDGWTEHRAIVTPSFVGRFDLKITGRDRNGIKDYIAETFHNLLSAPVRLSDLGVDLSE